MATKFRILRGLEANLPKAYSNGSLYISTDTGAIYVDNATSRDQVGGTVIKITTGTDLIGGDIKRSGTISHAAITRTDGTATAENPGYGKTFNVVDSIATSNTGHVTGVKTKTITMPTETHYTANLITGTSATAKTNAAASTNGKVYLNLVENNAVRNSHNIVGSGSVTVTSDANGKITINGTTYSAGTGISLSGTTFSNSGVRSIGIGSTNGTISVNTNGTVADVAITGLGSAAYTASTAYATAAQGTKADNAVPNTRTVNGKALSGNITLSASDVGADASGAASGVQTNLNSHTGNKSNPHGVTAAQVGAPTTSGTNTFTGKNIFTASDIFNTLDTQKFVVGDSNSAFVIGSDGLQTFSGTASTTPKTMYINCYGGDISLGNTKDTASKISVHGSLNVTSTATIQGNLTVNGGTVTANTFSGNAATATTATNATNVKSSPSTSKAYILGTTSTGSATNKATVYNASVYTSGSVLYGAAWNDYAEFRETIYDIEPGRCVVETGLGDLLISHKRLQPGVNVVSDTFGFAIGETNKCKTPIAVAGRVLVYPYEDKETYKAGDAVCSGPNGTVSIMTREEIIQYPDRIVGTVSEIPYYETWGENNVAVNGRIWIKIK